MLLKYLMASMIYHGWLVNYSWCKKINMNGSHIWTASFAKLFTGETWPVTNIKSTGTNIGKKTVGKRTIFLHCGKSPYLIILPRDMPNERNHSGQLFRHLWQIKIRNGGKIKHEENDELITSDDDICEIFNDYFTNISTTIGFADSTASTEHVTMY